MATAIWTSTAYESFSWAAISIAGAGATTGAGAVSIDGNTATMGSGAPSITGTTATTGADFPITWESAGRDRFVGSNDTWAGILRRGDVRIDDYAPDLIAPTSWLGVVEARIRKSVLPDEYRRDPSMEWPSTEWLNERAANAAIAFFHTGADLLPTEPHIYATKSGDLVAEFETSAGRMTSVVSDNETILFAVMSGNPEEPIQRVIRRGSNKFRDELRSFTKEFTSGSYGDLAATK